MSEPIEIVLAALERAGCHPRQTRAGQWTAHCPAHDDETPSLSVTIASRENASTVLLHCFAGCSTESILRALALEWKDLFANEERALQQHRSSSRTENSYDTLEQAIRAYERQLLKPNRGFYRRTVYAYRDESGNQVGVVVRWDWTDESGQHHKEIRPISYENGRWYFRGIAQPRPLYRLPELLSADRDQFVFVVEGEKCVEALRQKGLVATTNAGGAQAVKQTNWEPVRGRQLIIVPDNDDAGQRWLSDVLSLEPVRQAVVRVLPLGESILDLPPGGDIADVLCEPRWLKQLLGDSVTDDNVSRTLLEYVANLPIVSRVPELSTSQAPQVDVTVRDHQLRCKHRTHADFLATLLRNKVRYATHEGCWRHWTGKVWVKAHKSETLKLAQDALLAHYKNMLDEARARQDLAEIKTADTLFTQAHQVSYVSAALKLLAGFPDFSTKPEQWDNDPWLLNVENGVLDIYARRLRPHAPEYLCTKLARVTYDEQAKTELWQHHLELFLPNENVRRQVQRYLGTCLAGVVLQEALQIWYGTGANGKTTTSRVLLQLLGSYADRAAPNLLVDSKYDRHPTEIAELCGLRLVFSTEIDRGKRLAEALVKELTGGDRKKARFLHQDFFSFEQTFSIILITNHKPVVRGADEGIWRRIQLVPWQVQIPSSMQRAQDEIVESLIAEGPGILNWLLDGLYDWAQDRNWVAEEVRAANQEYRDEMDVLSDFLSDCCEFDQHAETPKAVLYAAYQRWCERTGDKPLSRRAFSLRMQEHGIAGGFAGHNNTRVFRGVRLKPETQGHDRDRW